MMTQSFLLAPNLHQLAKCQAYHPTIAMLLHCAKGIQLHTEYVLCDKHCDEVVVLHPPI